MCPASAEDKYYAIRLIKYPVKKRKKIKNTRGVHIRGLSKKYPTFGGEKYISYVTGLGP